MIDFKFNGFDVVYNDAGEREARAVVLYANSSKLYVDAKHATEVDYNDAVTLCEKGLLRVFDTDTFYTPTSFKIASGALTVGYGASKTATVSDPLA